MCVPSFDKNSFYNQKNLKNIGTVGKSMSLLEFELNLKSSQTVWLSLSLSLSTSTFFCTFYFQVIVDSHAVVKNNTEISYTL